ncbi:hypothetical protein R4Z10_03275 [Niallia sp. XMNu-256]|uniref:hypothetical protein n=1 Tax=Niallia sp. XMNu-256 TaxID=3082444 RepID=UPI0030CCEB49
MNNHFPPNSGDQPGFNPNDMQNKCWQYMNYHVIGQMADGTQVEGIIEDVDDDGVTMLVPEDVDGDERLYGYGGYGRRRRYRRFLRRRYPFTVFAFPFIFPFPYYY